MKRGLLVWLACMACSKPAAPTGELAGAVATVGDRRLEPELLARLMAARPQTPPHELVTAWTRTTLLASAADERGVLHEGRSSALVRRLVSDWTAAAAFPPEATADDIAEARTQDWQRFDRGPSVVVHHAVFMKTRTAGPSFATDAMQLAKTFAAHVDRSWDFAQFSAAAKALPVPAGIEVRAEQLPAFVVDGRATEGPSGFDKTFARQAFTLQAPGDSTAPFETPFGVHVIQLERVVDAVHASDAEIASALRPELVGRRVRRRQGEALNRMQPRLPVTIAPSAEEEMTLWVGRALAPREAETPEAR